MYGKFYVQELTDRGGIKKGVEINTPYGKPLPPTANTHITPPINPMSLCVQCHQDREM